MSSQLIAGLLFTILSLIGAMAVSFCVAALFGDGWSWALMPVWFWYGWKLLETINFQSPKKDSLHV